MSIDVSSATDSATPTVAGTLCVDIGGSAVKGGTVGVNGVLIGERIRIPTTYPLTPEQLVEDIGSIAKQSAPATRVSLGFPGMVRRGQVFSAPHFITAKGPGTAIVPTLEKAWDRFPLADQVAALVGLPCRLANDADVQGLAAIKGIGLELVVTLGTGVGTALFLDGEPGPHLELAHHPLRKSKTYNEVLGEEARKKAGNRRWSKRVDEMVRVIYALTYYDTLYIGGGNASRLTKDFTGKATIVDNADGILGGVKLWSLTRLA
jgi:polyphosphate glucokinase